MKKGLLFAVGATLLAGACAPPPIKDYEAFYDHTPYTVVVLPVTNETVDAMAPRYFLSTVGKYLVDRGYYVLPVQLTAEVLEAEGLGEGGSFTGVQPQKFKEHFGADAFLRITLKSWDTVYLVLASSVKVAMHYELISTKSGATLWETDHQQTIQSQSHGSLLEILVSAAVTATATDYVLMAQTVNKEAFGTLPPGPYNEGFEEARKRHLEESKRKKEKAAKEATEKTAKEAKK